MLRRNSGAVGTTIGTCRARRRNGLLYQIYEMTHAVVAPLRAASHVARVALNNPVNPWSYSYPARATSAALEVFEGLTRQYGRPDWDIDRIAADGVSVDVTRQTVQRKPFCKLKRFLREDRKPGELPRMLVVAPLSGHYATLLRGTVRTLVEDFEVYVTDWADARDVPLAVGPFHLDDYIRYIIEFLRELGPDMHVLAVCQPGPSVLAATALLSEDDDPCVPATVTIMGSPIDTRLSPTEPNRLAKTRPLSWFENNVILRVPFPHAGFMREVYPGFLQLTGFMTMNLDRHLTAHSTLYQNLVSGDGDSVAAHRKFYDEYLAVMDLPAEYYLDTIRVVFQEHQLAEGIMHCGDRRVDPGAIRRTALMTVEGENDDISGIGQTQAAHALCHNIPEHKRVDYIQPGVGHYGVFNGSRWRAEIAPRIRDFTRSNPTAGA